MDVNAVVNTTLKAVRDGTLKSHTDEDLVEMVVACNWYLQSNPNSPAVKAAITALHHEQSLRQSAKQHAALVAEQRTEHERLRASVQKLEEPHWSQTPGFWVAVLAMVFAGIAAVPVIHSWIPTSPRADKAASFPPLLSNSAPMTAPTIQTSKSAPSLIQGTNQLRAP